jgi:hypothetical protein
MKSHGGLSAAQFLRGAQKGTSSTTVLKVMKRRRSIFPFIDIIRENENELINYQPAALSAKRGET